MHRETCEHRSVLQDLVLIDCSSALATPGSRVRVHWELQSIECSSVHTDPNGRMLLSLNVND